MDFPIDTLKRPLKDLRISVIDQCNFRCPYCMPAEVFGNHYAFLKRDELLNFDEITRLTRIAADLGVHKIRLTGGEPLLRKDIDQLIKMLVAIPRIDDLALTTNGVLLPRFAERLKNAGMKRITVSLDALDNDCFQKMNGRNVQVAAVLKGIEAAAAAGLRIKINMVVQKGVNESEILPMSRFFKQNGHTLRFIEFMDVGNHNGWKMEQVFPSRRIVELIQSEFPLEPLNPNYPGEVARRYRYSGTEVEIGVIASVTQPFCANCMRSRLSADGKLYTCLFANEGWDLREVLRNGETDDDIRETLRAIWENRHDRYSELRTEILKKHLHPHKVEMSYIGG